MKPIFALLLLVVSSNALGQSVPFTQRLYTDLTWGIRLRASHRTNEITTLVTGTFWVTEINGQRVILTAAHNLGLGPNIRPTQIGNFTFPSKTAEILSVAAHPVLGLMAFEVAEIGGRDPNADWRVLKPQNDKALFSSKVLPIANTLPELGERVRVIGYPDTAHEQTISTTVASIGEKGDFIVLNSPLAAGYSGGVVLNEKNEAVGLVVTTEVKMSAALLLSASRFSEIIWHPFKNVQSHRLDAR